MSKSQAQKAKDALDASNAAKEAAKDNNAPEQPTEAEKAAQVQAGKDAAKAIADALQAAEDAKKPKGKGGYLNPFESGVTYEDFLNSIPKGKTVEAHCKGKMTKSELNWLVEEIKHFKNNKKK